MSAGMAGIIAEHQPRYLMPNAGNDAMQCECGKWRGDVVELHTAHVAEELTKAGYGLVQDAKAAALSDAADWLANGEAAGIVAYDGPSNRSEVTDAYDASLEDPKTWLRERTEAALAVDPADLYREERDGMAEAWREERAASADALNPYEDPVPLGVVAMNDAEGRHSSKPSTKER